RWQPAVHSPDECVKLDVCVGRRRGHHNPDGYLCPRAGFAIATGTRGDGTAPPPPRLSWIAAARPLIRLSPFGMDHSSGSVSIPRRRQAMNSHRPKITIALISIGQGPTAAVSGNA